MYKKCIKGFLSIMTVKASVTVCPNQRTVLPFPPYRSNSETTNHTEIRDILAVPRVLVHGSLHQPDTIRPPPQPAVTFSTTDVNHPELSVGREGESDSRAGDRCVFTLCQPPGSKQRVTWVCQNSLPEPTKHILYGGHYEKLSITV